MKHFNEQWLKERDTRRERETRKLEKLVSAVLVLAIITFCLAALTILAESSDDEVVYEAPVVQPVEVEACEADPVPEEDFENEKIEAALLDRATKLENVIVTHYCSERRPHICGTGDGITASGRIVTPYVSVAVDPSVIPLGSDVLVDYGDGEIHYYRADDTGAGVDGYHIDVAVTSHDEALELGIKTATVYWVAEEEIV